MVRPRRPVLSGRQLQVHTAEGAKFYVRIYDRGLAGDERRQAAIDLGRAAARRLSARFPGRQSALPRPTPPPFHPCLLVSVEEQVAELGWEGAKGRHEEAPTPTRPSASAWRQILRHRDGAAGWADEFAGGAAGRSWTCSRSRQPSIRGTVAAEVTFEIFKRRIAPDALVASPLRPIRVLQRPAFIAELPPPQAVPSEHLRKAAVFFSDPKGHLVGLYLRDVELDAAAHERHLVALAKIALSRVGR